MPKTITVTVPDPSTLPDSVESPRLSLSPDRTQSPIERQKSDKLGLDRLKADYGPNAALIEERQKVYELVKDLPRLPELDYKPTGKYQETKVESVLHPLIKRSNCMMVAGAYFGDEGKGKTVDAIAVHPKVEIVARVNSGENAGHTVISEAGIKYAFNLCPSGLLTPGKVNAIGPECVMDPVSFMEKEISQLLRDSVEYKDRLFVGNVHIVCPHHKLLDLMFSWKNPNASTLMGMGPVHASKAKRKGLRMDHLFLGKEIFGKQLEADMAEYEATMKQLGIDENELYDKASANPKIQKWVLDFIKAPSKVDYLYKLYDEHVVSSEKFPKRADVSHMLRDCVKKGGKVLLEGPQSFWLSNAQEHFWDSGTSAHTCAAGMMSASRLNILQARSCVINIHKTPGSSRVGAGANPAGFVPQNHWAKLNVTKVDFDDMELDWREVSTTFFGSIQENGVLKPQTYTNGRGTFDLGCAMAAATCVHPAHGEFGVTSGRPRVVGFFDCVAHAEAMSAQGPYCSISAFDRGDDYDEYGICIAYVFAHPEGKNMMCNGKVYESGTIIKAGDSMPTQSILHHCQPIIRKVRGWRDTPIFARGDWWKNRKVPVDLPEPICEMLDIIEHFTNTRVISIGNGPKGDEIIYIRKVTDKAKAKAKPKPKTKSKAKAKAAPEVAEKRIDPEDGGLYTFAELSAFYTGKYKKSAIAAYWDECKPAKSKKAKKK